MSFVRLKSKYREFNNEIGQTGAGLKAEEIVSGSELSNKIIMHANLY